MGGAEMTVKLSPERLRYETKRKRKPTHLKPHQHMTHGRIAQIGKGRPRTSWWTEFSREDFTAVCQTMVQPEIKVYKTPLMEV
jgi:hypothetical protein